jgi:hypothetical protein
MIPAMIRPIAALRLVCGAAYKKKEAAERVGVLSTARWEVV